MKLNHDVVFALIATATLAAVTCLCAHADPFYPVDARAPQTIESHYSPLICNVLKSWPPSDIPEPNTETVAAANPLWMRGIHTPGDDGYVGVEKRMLIHAPLAKVSALIKDFERYKDRNPDLKEVRVLARDGNRVTTTWETKSPVFFVPNTKYDLVWTMDDTSASRAVYRFQLLKSNHLKASDTLLVLDARGDSTLLTTYDFFQLDLGFVGAFATTKKVWKKSFESLYIGDIALKSQLEHPDWDAKRIKKEAETMLDRYPIEEPQFTSNPLERQPANAPAQSPAPQDKS